MEVEDLEATPQQRPGGMTQHSLFGARHRVLSSKSKRDTMEKQEQGGGRDAAPLPGAADATSAGGPNSSASASISSSGGPFVAFKRYLSGKLHHSSRGPSPADAHAANKCGPADMVPAHDRSQTLQQSARSNPDFSHDPPPQQQPQQQPLQPQAQQASHESADMDRPAVQFPPGSTYGHMGAAEDLWCQAHANGADDATLLSLAQVRLAIICVLDYGMLAMVYVGEPWVGNPAAR